MALFSYKRTKNGSNTLTESRNKTTGKRTTTSTYRTASGARVSTNLSTGKKRKTKPW